LGQYDLTGSPVFAPSHLDVARILDNLALVYETQGKYIQARQLLERLGRFGTAGDFMFYSLAQVTDARVGQIDRFCHHPVAGRICLL
jgi:hypothetical protein